MTPQQTQARQMVEALLCLDLTPATAQARTFTAREGMRTVFTGPFSNVSSVTVNGKAVTNYYPAFFDKRNGTLFNSIVFTEPVCGEVVVTGNWSATTLPADLQRLVDNALLVVNQAYSVKEVKSKRVEDFSVTYSDLSDDEAFLKQNAVTINKYSMCHIDYILHGETCYHGRFCSVC